MVNNIGKTTQILKTNLGETIKLSSNDIELITGELGTGLLVFDENGTLGVISNFNSPEEEFSITTYALSLDIQKILNLSY